MSEESSPADLSQGTEPTQAIEVRIGNVYEVGQLMELAHAYEIPTDNLTTSQVRDLVVEQIMEEMQVVDAVIAQIDANKEAALDQSMFAKAIDLMKAQFDLGIEDFQKLGFATPTTPEDIYNFLKAIRAEEARRIDVFTGTAGIVVLHPENAPDDVEEE